MWFSWLFAPGRRASAGNRRWPASRSSRPLAMEVLETRRLLAIDLRATLVDAMAEYTLPGQTLTVRTKVFNGGDASSERYSVKYYLSTDNLITGSDRILASAARSGLSPGTTASWTQSIAIPSDVLHDRYYVGIVVKYADDANPKNNKRSDANATAIFYAALTGTVAFDGTAHAVAIRPLAGGATPIFDNVPTWIVIHGRNSSPTSGGLPEAAAAVDGFSTTDQVLVLDWSSAAESGLIGGAGENYIKPVAAWASDALSGYGLAPQELNLIGHSWGACVAAELAELQPAVSGWEAGQVNSIVAIDPAVDYPGGSYNPTAAGEINFARNSRLSWSFYANGGLFGSDANTASADEAFVVTDSDHSGAVNVVAGLVLMSYSPLTSAAAQIGAHFRLDRLLSGAVNPAWEPNSYSSSGERSDSGAFEAVIAATSDGLKPRSLKYFDGLSEVTYVA